MTALRFALALAVLGAVNATGLWWIYQRMERPPAEPLLVASFDPEGEVTGHEAVRVEFTRNVLPPGSEVLPPADGLLALHPPVEGKARWDGSRALVFEPARALPGATTFRASLSEEIGRATGLRLEGTREFTFHTPPLRVAFAEQIAYSPDLRATARVRFNYPVEPEEAATRVRLLDGAGEVVPFDFVSARPSRDLDLRTRVPVESLEVLLDAGLPGTEGPLGLRTARRLPVPLNRRLRFEEASAEAVFAGWPDVTLRFNQPIDVERAGDLSAWIRVDPPVELETVHAEGGSGPTVWPRRGASRTSAPTIRPWSSRSPSRVVLSGEFRPGARYRITARQGLVGAHGTVLSEDTIRIVQVPDRPARVRFRDEGLYLAPHAGRVAMVSANVAAVRLTASRVYASNLVHYLQLGDSGYGDHFRESPIERHLEVEGGANDVVESAIDLHETLGGPVRGVWHLTAWPAGQPRWRSDELLVAVTDLAMSAKASERELLVWVTSIASGTPVAGARVEVRSRANQVVARAETGPDGIASFLGPMEDPDGGSLILVATSGEDLSFLRLDENRISHEAFDVRGRSYLARGYEAFLFPDRGVCRPGETVRLRTIVRGPRTARPGEFPVELEILRPDRKTFRRSTATLDEEGAAVWAVAIPDGARTGRYRARVRLPGDGATEIGTTSFFVEEFLPDRLRATLERVVGAEAGVGSSLEPGAPLRMRLGGEHLAGLPAAGASARLEWRLERRELRPEGWTGFVFEDPRAPPPERGDGGQETTLDSRGSALLDVETPGSGGQPLRLIVTGEVEDTGGRVVRAERAFDVDPVACYLGLRVPPSGRATAGPGPGSGAGTLAAGRPERIEVAAVRPDGEPGDLSSVRVRIVRREWTSVLCASGRDSLRYESRLKEVEVDERTLSLEGGRGEIECTFPRPGTYRIGVAGVGTAASAAIDAIVSGPGDGGPPRMERAEHLELTVAGGVHRVGGSARVRIEAPFPGTVWLTLETERILSSRVLAMDSPGAEFDIDIPPDLTVVPYVSATVVRGTGADLERGMALGSGVGAAPVRAWGAAPLWLDFSPRQLVVSIDGPRELRPMADAALRVRVADAEGEPAVARVALVLVDEGILARTGYLTPDPWAFFYGQRALAVEQRDLFGRLFPDVAASVRRALPGGDAAGTWLRPRHLSRVRARRASPVVITLGEGVTEEDGSLVRSVRLPPFTGRLRAMAVAWSGSRFGSTEKPILVRAPLHLEPGLPRFLAPSDLFASRLDVRNGTGRAGGVQVAWSFEGPVRPPSSPSPPDPSLAYASASASEETLSLEPGESTRIRRWLAAGDRPGIARVTIRAELDGERAEESVELAVRPAAAEVVRGSSGRIARGEPLELRPGEGFEPGSTRYRLTLSPLPGVRLFGSLAWLVRYPHGCLEQTTSKVFPLLYLSDLADLLEDGYLSTAAGSLDGREEQLAEFVRAGIDRVLTMQSPRGWFSMWPGGARPWSWGSIYATHFLVEAARAGHRVEPTAIDAALSHLETVVAAASSEPEANRLEAAYAAFVLAVAGRSDVRERLLEWEAPVLTGGRDAGRSGEAGFLVGAAWMALGDEERARRMLGGDLPAPPESVDDGGALRSPVRQAALVLSAILDVDPSSPRVPLLVERLDGARQGGRWGTTQDNAFAVLALGKYARQRRLGPDGGSATIVVRGGSSSLAAGASRTIVGDDLGGPVRVSVEDDGVLYWHIEERGLPLDGRDEDVDSGLRVERRILDAAGAEVTDGRISRGQVVQVEVSLSSARPCRNVVISDLLPAGLEVENPRLRAARTGAPASSELEASHLDIRDDRVLIYTDLPVGGETRRYRYAARATCAGDFVLPPIAAECMYRPGLHSRRGGGRIVIEEAGS